MVTQQILSKVLNDKSFLIVEKYGLTKDHFLEYDQEFDFIKNHVVNHGNVPDDATFLSKFPDFTILEVNESEEWLVEQVEEEYLYAKAVPVIQQCAALMQTDSAEAVEYLKFKLPELEVRTHFKGEGWIANSEDRYEAWKRKTEESNIFIESSWKELDDVTGGWRRGEELVVLFARTGHGKTFALLEILRSACLQGYKVGMLEPEMSAKEVGYRLDTLQSHISNTALYRGYCSEAYEEYMQSLDSSWEADVVVATPKDFGKKVTVSKLRTWAQNNKFDVLAVDGISYLRDERAEKSDSRTIQLTNISEDLMSLSQDLGIPVFVVSQANRSGVQTETPGLESIRDSDGIAYNASLVLSLRKDRMDQDTVLTFSIEKSRHGQSSVQLTYNWDPDHGVFSFRGEAEELRQEQPVRQNLTASRGTRAREEF